MKKIPLLLCLAMLVPPAFSKAADEAGKMTSPTVLTPEQQAKLNQCYNEITKDLPHDKVPKGKIVAKWTLGDDGKALDAKILKKESTLRNEKLNDCLLKEIKAWTFMSPLDEHILEMSFKPETIKADLKKLREEFRRTIKGNLGDIKKCYDAALESSPADKPPQGKATFTWEIQADGKTAKAAPDPKKSTLDNAELNQCIVDKINQWVFSKPPDNNVIEMTYPFHFTPAPDKRDRARSN